MKAKPVLYRCSCSPKIYTCITYCTYMHTNVNTAIYTNKIQNQTVNYNHNHNDVAITFHHKMDATCRITVYTLTGKANFL